jgi:hypothetical protein
VVKLILGEDVAELWGFFVSDVASTLHVSSNTILSAPMQLISGRIDTAFWNAWLNDCAIAWALEEEGIDVGKKADYVVEGDDNTMGTESKESI